MATATSYYIQTDESKMSKKKQLHVSTKRDRNDSGCVEDLSPPASASIPDENQHWQALINDWSGKTHSIISQEVTRMQAMTEERRREMAAAVTRTERELVVRRWKEEMEGMMEITVDLIQCVANDVVETNNGGQISSTSESGSSTLSSHDLGKILEEELFDKQDGGDRKIFMVKTRKKKKSPRRGKKKRQGWEPTNSFTIRVEELHKKEGPATNGDVMSGSWHWQKDLDSPTVWNEEEEETDKKEIESDSPEDIFRDWLRLLRKLKAEEKAAASADINEIFWSISLDDAKHGRRQRRISEVLENLPFDDQPDIFGDRCELLEAPFRASKKTQQKASATKKKRTGGGRPQKLYWNIFADWIHVFNEPGGGSGGMRKRAPRSRQSPRKGRRRRTRPKKEASAQQQQQQQIPPGMKIFQQGCRPSPWYHCPKRYVLLPPLPPSSSKDTFDLQSEDYFSDFVHNFIFDDCGSEIGRRRRSRDDVDDGDEMPAENVRKRRKTDHFGGSGSYKRNWEIIRLESSRTFDMITKSIEQKIREAFMEEASSQRGRSRTAVGSEEVGSDAEKKMLESRKEFERLREQVRMVRREWKVEVDRAEVEDWFQEWSWNMEDDSETEVVKTPPKLSLSIVKKPPQPPFVVVHDKMSLRVANLHTLKRPKNARAVKMGKERKRLMNRCLAKQPRNRGIGGKV